ncbi:hypothetical protein [Pantoea vagans]|uniref:hypothetical protein n=1 Tax=Pantoea vagans TaxID=470934 RepID=UPI003B02DA8A
MTKKVTAILPGDIVQVITVEDNDDKAIFRGENGSVLTLPVVPYVVNGQKHHVSLWSDEISDERIEEAIRLGR